MDKKTDEKAAAPLVSPGEHWSGAFGEHISWPTGRVHPQDSHRWGVILACGDGKRLLPFNPENHG